MGLAWKGKGICVCSPWPPVWAVLSHPNLPSESCLLAALRAPAAFQRLDSCIPCPVAWSQPLGQNAGTSEANCVSLHLGTCPLHVDAICMRPLHFGSGSALPFQDCTLFFGSVYPMFFVTFLVAAPPKLLYVSVHCSFNVCHTMNYLMTFPIVSITNILEGKA